MSWTEETRPSTTWAEEGGASPTFGAAQWSWPLWMPFMLLGLGAGGEHAAGSWTEESGRPSDAFTEETGRPA